MYNEEELINSVNSILTANFLYQKDRYDDLNSSDLNSISFDATDIINQWVDNKFWLRNNFFGDDLIISSKEKLTFYMTEEEKETTFALFLRNLEEKLYSLPRINVEEFHSFMDYVKLNKKGFFSNKIVSLDGYENKLKRAKVGDKLLKSFKYFDIFNIVEIQDFASHYIQQQKITGYLCASIHPLDYLTISDNKKGWTSCHGFGHEYYGGNFSYMTDTNTVVCYLKTDLEDNTELLGNSIKWNNKKWRVLVHFSNSGKAIWFNKPYPFHIKEIFEKIVELFNAVKVDKNELYDTELTRADIQSVKVGDIEQQLDARYLLFTDIIVPAKEIFLQDKGAMFYNDLLYSTAPIYYTRTKLTFENYDGMYMMERHWFVDEEEVRELFVTSIGEPVKCPLCHKHYMWDEDLLICDDCADKIESQLLN